MVPVATPARWATSGTGHAAKVRSVNSWRAASRIASRLSSASTVGMNECSFIPARASTPNRKMVAERTSRWRSDQISRGRWASDAGGVDDARREVVGAALEVVAPDRHAAQHLAAVVLDDP